MSFPKNSFKMICTSFLWCIFFFATLSVSRGYEDPFIIPVCENQGPEDVYLDFSNGEFNKLSKSPMIDWSVKCLNFDNNQIRGIDRDAFDNVPELHYLNLSRNPIDFGDFMKTSIQNLETLILDGPLGHDNYRYSQFIGYDDDVDDYDVSRREDNIYRNRYGVESVSLPKLKKLSLRHYGSRYSKLSNARLTTLDVPNLTHLYLSGNHLTTIANLARMPNLTHLNLDDNNMEYISGSMLRNVKYLSMDRNNIERVCGTFCSLHSIAPRKMHNLKYLSLAGNNIDIIDSDAFADLENLLVLNLAKNNINNFQQHTFDNVTKLQNLTLDKNKLTTVPDVGALQELHILSLNENNIVAIDEMTFCNMPKLAVVYLRKNGLTTIANMAFDNLPTLTMLDLSWNNIDSLSEHWILPSNSLKVLLLDGNKFTELGNMSLEQLHNLEVLGLAYNPIKKISARSMMKLAADVVIDVTLDSSVPPECNP